MGKISTFYHAKKSSYICKKIFWLLKTSLKDTLFKPFLRMNIKDIQKSSWSTFGQLLYFEYTLDVDDVLVYLILTYIL